MDTEHLMPSSSFCQWWLQSSIWTRKFIFLCFSLRPHVPGDRVISQHLGWNRYPINYKKWSIL